MSEPTHEQSAIPVFNNEIDLLVKKLLSLQYEHPTGKLVVVNGIIHCCIGELIRSVGPSDIGGYFEALGRDLRTIGTFGSPEFEPVKQSHLRRLREIDGHDLQYSQPMGSA